MTALIDTLLVGLGGSLGAITRYHLSGWVQRWYNGSFPLGTLTVNVIGCLVIGCLMTLVEEYQAMPRHWRLTVITGLLGALTTFSTFGHETFALIQTGQPRLAGLNMLANAAIGLAAVWLGRGLIRWWW